MRAWMPIARLWGPGRRLVDDAGLDATGQQLRGEGEPGRAGADDQDLAVGQDVFVFMRQPSGGRARQDRLKDYVDRYVFHGLPYRPASSSCTQAASWVRVLKARAW